MTASEALEAASRDTENQQYTLRLYVAGLSPRSQEAIRTITAICKEHLAGRYKLEVIDIYQHPQMAKNEQIIAVPTLVKKLPLPLRKIIGSMVDREKVLLGMDLRRK
jgi:circadian clock protein KaiB